jgi:hypothetical protein
MTPGFPASGMAGAISTDEGAEPALESVVALLLPQAASNRVSPNKMKIRRMAFPFDEINRR